MTHLLIIGPGYSASRIGLAAAHEGARISHVTRHDLDDADFVTHAVQRASHILSSVPPGEDGDPVLRRYGSLLASAPALWIGYLSSTGVYGDSKGAWVDESAPLAGRRSARLDADRAWADLHRATRIFRLPGIYGPGRSALDRVRAGQAHRIDAAGQVFSRVHVDDIASAVLASMKRGLAGAYNVADDEPAPQAEVVRHAALLLGLSVPPLQSLEDARLSPAARAFYGENRRIANGRARRLLGWRPRFPDFRAGLRHCLAAEAGVEMPPPPPTGG